MDSHSTTHSPVDAPALVIPSAPATGRQLSPIKTTTNIYDFRSSDIDMLSPPITPVKRPRIEMQMQMNTPKSRTIFPPTPRASLEERPAMTWATTTPKPFVGKYSIGKQVGNGAWSAVSIAEEVVETAPRGAAAGSLTPPPSPDMRQRGAIFAIKTPNQKSARRVLTREARVLTFLSADLSAQSFIVGFHGQDPTTDALVLDFVPQTLSRFVAERRNALQLSTRTMYDPVIGEAAWKDLARQLTSGVAWLHSRGVIHGDIKADNILMKRRTTAPSTLDLPATITSLTFQPLLCDFSSALVLSEPQSDRDEADDAITTTYASPELLDSFRFVTRTFAKPVDRKKSDVWATAVALVLAATGGEPYAEARMSMQRTAMAKHGDVLGSVRGGSQATRIMKGGFVARTVAPALAMKAEDRVEAAKWVEKLAEIFS